MKSVNKKQQNNSNNNIIIFQILQNKQVRKQREEDTIRQKINYKTANN